MTPKTPRNRRAQDLTLINLRAEKRRLFALEVRIAQAQLRATKAMDKLCREVLDQRVLILDLNTRLKKMERAK